MDDQDIATTASAIPNDGSTATPRSAIPQIALDAANAQIEKIGGSLTGAADSIDELFERGDLPGGESVQHLAGDAARRLRDIGERTTSLDAEALLGEAQRVAAARPGLAIAAGAAAGAVLAYVFLRTAPAAQDAARKPATAGAGSRTTT